MQGIYARLGGFLRTRLLRESASGLVCGLVFALQQWIVLKFIFYYLGTDAGGWYTLAGAITAPVIGFLGMNQRAALVTDGGQTRFAVYFRHRLLAVVVAFGLLVPCYPLFDLAGDGAGIFTFCAFVAGRGMEAISDIVQGEYQRQGRLGVVAVSFCLRLGLNVGSIVVGILWLGSLTLALCLSALATATVIGLWEMKHTNFVGAWRGGVSWGALRALTAQTWPLGVTTLALAVQAGIPRYALKAFGSMTLLGVFSALSYILLLGGFVASAIGMAISPILSSYREQRRATNFKRLMLWVLAADVVIGFLMWGLFEFFGQSILVLLFNREVGAYASYLPLVSLCAILVFWDAHLGVAITALRRFAFNMAVLLARIVFVTPIVLILSHKWGLGGVIVGICLYPLASIPFLWYVLSSELKNWRSAATSQAIVAPVSG